MANKKTVAYLTRDTDATPQLIREFSEENDLRVVRADTPKSLAALMNRSYPACVILDSSQSGTEVLEVCRQLKADSFTGIVPVVVILSETDSAMSADALEAGADEVITHDLSDREKAIRLRLLLHRAARDVSVHPSTRLPGTAQIERDLSERLAAEEIFAVCYADLDHFKEFNDRYGYNNGDRVILLVSRILRDVVRGLAPTGFVGHIGGDDFIFTIPIETVEAVCDEILEVFDQLAPYQYEEEDRKAGYFLGKDRRGNVHQVPLMTLSIGVVTNQRLPFSHTAQISELAAEMKTFAKTHAGSVYVVDRRHGSMSPEPESEAESHAEPLASAASGH